MKHLIRYGLALSLLIVVVEGAAKKQPKPQPDPAFAAIENISVLPIVDARAGQKANVNLEKLQESVVRTLKKKRYTAAAANTSGKNFSSGLAKVQTSATERSRTSETTRT